MKMNENCLPCIVGQGIKIANLLKIEDRDKLYKDIFRYLSEADFEKTNPELIGEIFTKIKNFTGNSDPYKTLRTYYNKMFLEMEQELEDRINKSVDPFLSALIFAVAGNIIDFNPVHGKTSDEMLEFLKKADTLNLYKDESTELLEDIKSAKSLMYIGDNCGEIILDKIFIKKIKELNPNCQVLFAVRGAPVVNDSVLEDAYFVGMDKYAQIISNGDYSLGTVIERVNKEFLVKFKSVDFVIAKGQANYESLSDVRLNKIYSLLMAKCKVIADYANVPINSAVCMKISSK